MIQYVPTACNELVSQVVRTSAEVKKRAKCFGSSCGLLIREQKCLLKSQRNGQHPSFCWFCFCFCFYFIFFHFCCEFLNTALKHRQTSLHARGKKKLLFFFFAGVLIRITFFLSFLSFFFLSGQFSTQLSYKNKQSRSRVSPVSSLFRVTVVSRFHLRLLPSLALIETLTRHWAGLPQVLIGTDSYFLFNNQAMFLSPTPTPIRP